MTVRAAASIVRPRSDLTSRYSDSGAVIRKSGGRLGIAARSAAAGAPLPSAPRRPNQPRLAGWTDSSTRSHYPRPPPSHLPLPRPARPDRERPATGRPRNPARRLERDAPADYRASHDPGLASGLL